MSMNDFFSKVDQKIDKIKQQHQQSETEANENLEFLEEIVAELTNKVEAYVNQIRNRGITVDFHASKSGILFNLKYKDGGHFGTRLGRSKYANNNRIEITGSFTNDDGKNYTSTSGTTYDRQTWKDEYFISSIEKCIDDYLFYAPRHGGQIF